MKSRIQIVNEFTALCMINQFMMYLGLDDIVTHDETILNKVFTKNSNIEFKHVIFLVYHDEIPVTIELKTKIINNEEFKWCKDIERDFAFEE